MKIRFTKKLLPCILSVCLMFTFFVVPSQAASVNSSNQTQSSSYTYNGITYYVTKATLTDGSEKVNVTSTADSATILINKDKTSESITQSLADPNVNGKINTKVVNLSLNLNTISSTAIANSISQSNVISPMYSSSSSVKSKYWGYSAAYAVSSYGITYTLYDPDRGLLWDDGMPIGSSEDTLCDQYYSQVVNVNSWQIGSIAAGGVGVTSAVAGVLAGLETVGIATVIGLVMGLGGAIVVAYDMYNSWCAAQAANKYFDELCAKYPWAW